MARRHWRWKIESERRGWRTKEEERKRGRRGLDKFLSSRGRNAIRTKWCDNLFTNSYRLCNANTVIYARPAGVLTGSG